MDANSLNQIVFNLQQTMLHLAMVRDRAINTADKTMCRNALETINTVLGPLQERLASDLTKG